MNNELLFPIPCLAQSVYSLNQQPYSPWYNTQLEERRQNCHISNQCTQEQMQSIAINGKRGGRGNSKGVENKSRFHGRAPHTHTHTRRRESQYTAAGSNIRTQSIL